MARLCWQLTNRDYALRINRHSSESAQTLQAEWPLMSEVLHALQQSTMTYHMLDMKWLSSQALIDAVCTTFLQKLSMLNKLQWLTAYCSHH
jgi:hypothetical protein